MRIESSQLLMQMEHHSESQLAMASMILPQGQAPNFGDLFAQLSRQTPANTPETNTAERSQPLSPGLLMANIAGARQLRQESEDKQTRLLRLVEEMLSTLEGLLLKVGRGENLDSTDFAEKLAAASAAEADTGQWTRVTLVHTKESESLCFASQGCVRTEDGREIRFDMGFSMSRETESTTLEWLSGSLSRLVDPLILNFPGQGLELTGTTIAFDLTADGLAEKLPLLAGASGYLAFDRNGDGNINDGTELFGALSGNGFADLTLLDEDGNQWIDDGDSFFEKLLLWRPDGEGKGELLNLKELGIGALALQSLLTPFTLKDEAGQTQGAIRRSGLWLGENGGAGSLMHLDVAT